MTEDAGEYRAGEEREHERRRLETEFDADRPAVRQALLNWGDWSYGGLPALGYPRRDPHLDTSPPRGERTYDPDAAAVVEFVLSGLMAASLSTTRYALMLRTEYLLSERPEIERARRWKMSRSTWQRRVREAEFAFWMLWKGLDRI